MEVIVRDGLRLDSDAQVINALYAPVERLRYLKFRSGAKKISVRR